jgi:hypothetical protein
MMAKFLCVKCHFCKTDIQLQEMPPDFVLGRLPQSSFNADHHECGLEFTYTVHDLYPKHLEPIPVFVPRSEFSLHPR